MIGHEVINLFYSSHTAISDSILAIMQNVRYIISSVVITWLYLQTKLGKNYRKIRECVHSLPPNYSQVLF